MAKEFPLVLCIVIVFSNAQNHFAAEPEITDEVLQENNADEAYGDRQIRQMLADRPDMRGYIKPGGSLWLWLRDRFAGAWIGSRVYWDVNEPQSKRPAECAGPYGGVYPAIVRITADQNISGGHKWLCLFYELFNVADHKHVRELTTKACNGEFERETYALKMVESEHNATLKLRWFAKSHDFTAFTKDDESLKGDYLDDSLFKGLEDYLNYLDNHPTIYDPRKYFRRFYDTEIVPRQPKRKLLEFGRPQP